MELVHLRYFLAVAEELHVTRAARRLRRAPSPVSKRIRDLERELGTTLFDRTAHRIRLTDAGRELLPLARDVVQRVDALPAELARRTAGAATAAIGMAPDVPPPVQDAFLGAVRSARPGLGVRVRPGNSAPLLRAVRAGELDLVIVHGRPDGPDLASVRLDSRPAVVVVARGIGFDDRTGVRLAELGGLPYASIAAEAAPSVYRAREALLSRKGVTGRIELETANPGDLTRVVATGRAFTFAGAGGGTTDQAFADEPVVLLPVEDAEVQLSTEAVWRADRETGGDVVEVLAAAARVTAGPSP